MSAKLLLLSIFLFCYTVCAATHLNGGEIWIEKVSGFKYKITVIGYTRADRPVKFGSAGNKLDFGDGTTDTIPEGDNPSIIGTNSEGAVGMYSYSVEHVYPGSGFYTVSYFESNLENNLLNVDNSIDSPLYLQSGFLIDPNVVFTGFKCPALPLFSFPLGRTFSFSTAATTHSENTFYTYQISPPGYLKDFTIPNGLTMNHVSGLVSWDLSDPQIQPGSYLLGVRINQYDANKKFLGYMNRVFTFDLIYGDSRIAITSNIADPDGSVTVLTGNQKTIRVFLSDTTKADTLRWSFLGDSSVIGNINFTQYDSSTADRKFRVGVLQLSTTNTIESNIPYALVLRGRSWLYSTQKDISFLWFTKNVPFPMVITATAKPSDEDETAYPNPFNNELFFSGVPGETRVLIFSTFGQCVSQTVTDQDGKIETSTLPGGLYICTLPDQRRSFKVIKK